jgi:hypothetical protein
MHDHIPQVDQDPGPVLISFYSRFGKAGGFDAFQDRVDDGADLNLRAPRDERKGVCKNRATAYVDCDEVIALLVERGIANEID